MCEEERAKKQKMYSKKISQVPKADSSESYLIKIQSNFCAYILLFYCRLNSYSRDGGRRIHTYKIHRAFWWQSKTVWIANGMLRNERLWLDRTKGMMVVVSCSFFFLISFFVKVVGRRATKLSMVQLFFFSPSVCSAFVLRYGYFRST